MFVKARIVALVISALLALTLAEGQAAGPPDEASGKSAHDRVIEYWTPARVAGALPRQLLIADPPLQLAPAARPPGGGGNGGGSAVTGAPWLNGGLVKATTGKVLFTLGGIDYVCSGSVVADLRLAESLVLTAGHCTFDDQTDEWATNWMFVPDYEHAQSFDCQSTHYGCWTAAYLVTTTAWAAGDFNDDYAFAVMWPGGLDGGTLLEDAVGAQAIAFDLAHPRQVSAFGYPHAAPYDGQSLIYCAGTDQRDTWGGSTDFGLKCDMTGGSSGGPWFANFDATTGRGELNSVNSFKYTRGPLSKYMFGPYFDGYTNKTYLAAQVVVTNTTVDP